MFSPEIPTLSVIFLYFAASATGLSGLIWQKASLRKAGSWLAIASFFCQTLILIFGFHKSLPDGISLGAYMQLLAWFLLLCCLGVWLRIRQDAILIFASSLCLLLFILSANWLNLPHLVPSYLSTPFYTLHIGALYLSLGLLALAFIAGVIFVFLEKRIKTKKSMKGMWNDMPALGILDKINYLCVIVCYPLYTLGLITGFFWARLVFGSAMNADPKEIASLCIWLLLSVLFYGRIGRGWRGRKPAYLASLIFILSFASIVLINLYLPTHHSFIRY